MVSGLYTFESKKLKLILLKIIAVLFLSQLIYIYILLPGATEIIISLTTSEIINYIPKISEYTTFLIKLSLNSNIFFFYL
jgi:Sec-independent protein secretion pathway component TatC